MKSIPISPLLLGYAGALPFIFLAFNLLTGKPLFFGFALQAFMIYSAVILSFLGGIRWAAALDEGRVNTLQLVVSVVPSLWAVASLLLPDPRYQVVALAAGYLLLGLLDAIALPKSLPGWLRPLRLQLTGLVLLSHLAAGWVFWR